MEPGECPRCIECDRRKKLNEHFVAGRCSECRKEGTMIYPNSDLCPEHTREAIDNYVHDRIPPGSFTMAILENAGIMEVLGRADDINMWALPHICHYIYNRIPSACHGSPEKVAAWLEQG